MSIVSTSCVHASLPRAGLGNKLLVWAKGYVFSRQHGLPLMVDGWLDLQLRAMIKGGKTRIYWNYFRRCRELPNAAWRKLKANGSLTPEPSLSGQVKLLPHTIYQFTQIPHWSDYFAGIRENRELVCEGLKAMLTTTRQRELTHLPAPVVCLHVRLGDYRPLKPGEDFKQAGNCRTPLDYFREMIVNLRKVQGSDLPVTIVSDGSDVALRELLEMPNVTRGPSNSDLGDINMMSRAKVLVCSAGSTFSLWGGFLGNGVMLHHPDHFHATCRPVVENGPFEGTAGNDPALWPVTLTEQVKAIR